MASWLHYERHDITAGQQFDGTPDKGEFAGKNSKNSARFFKKGAVLQRVTVTMGAEAKDLKVEIVDDNGSIAVLEDLTATAAESVIFIGPIPFSPMHHERISVTTANATSAMHAEVIVTEL